MDRKECGSAFPTSTVIFTFVAKGAMKYVLSVPAVYISADVCHNIQYYLPLKLTRDVLLSLKWACWGTVHLYSHF